MCLHIHIYSHLKRPIAIMEAEPNISQLPLVPVMSRDRFAEHVGVTPDVVTGWISRGYVPVVPIGKYNLINVALLTKMSLEREFSL